MTITTRFSFANLRMFKSVCFMKRLLFLVLLASLMAACDSDTPITRLPEPPTLVAGQGTTLNTTTAQNPTGNIKFSLSNETENALNWELKYQPALVENGDAIRLHLRFDGTNKQNANTEFILQDSVYAQNRKVALNLKKYGFPTQKQNSFSKIRINYFDEFGAKSSRIISLNDENTLIDTYTLASGKNTAEIANDSRGVYCYRSYNGTWICTTRWDANARVFMEQSQHYAVLITLEPLTENETPYPFNSAPNTLNVSTNSIPQLTFIPSPILSLGQIENAQSNTDLLIPLHAENATFGAMSIEILYDPNRLTFKGLSNASTAGIQASASNGILKIAWANESGFTWSNNKIADLQFGYTTGTTDLQFLPQTEASKPDGRLVTDLNLRNGSIQ